jgi:hypothetical protein
VSQRMGCFGEWQRGRLVVRTGASGCWCDTRL